MAKKLAAILILCSLIISIAPLEAFCDDHFDSSPATHNHCNSICHTNFNVTVPQDTSFHTTFKDTALHITQDFSYQNPTIARLKRPPITIS